MRRLLGGSPARAQKPLEDNDPPGTFSVLGFDPATGEIGGAVQSRVFSVGNGPQGLAQLVNKVRPLFVVLVGFACSPAAPAPGNLTVTRFNSTNSSFMLFSGFSQRTTAVIRDDAAWQGLWGTLYAGQSPAPPLPAIDFSNEMVVAAAIGTQPTSGYDVIVQSANESDGAVTIETRETRPGPKCAVLTVLTSPVDLARVPRRTGSVTFHSTEGVNNCGPLAR